MITEEIANKYLLEALGNYNPIPEVEQCEDLIIRWLNLKAHEKSNKDIQKEMQIFLSVFKGLNSETTLYRGLYQCDFASQTNEVSSYTSDIEIALGFAGLQSDLDEYNQGKNSNNQYCILEKHTLAFGLTDFLFNIVINKTKNKRLIGEIESFSGEEEFLSFDNDFIEHHYSKRDIYDIFKSIELQRSYIEDWEEFLTN